MFPRNLGNDDDKYNREEDNADDGEFKFVKEHSTIVIERQRSDMVTAFKQPGQGDEMARMEFYEDAPTHFASVHELVQVVCGYLPDKRSVLSAASVNRKWRHALMWDDYETDVQQMPVSAYGGERVEEGGYGELDISQDWAASWFGKVWWFPWWFSHAVQWLILIIWLASERTKRMESFHDMWVAGIVIPSLYMGWKVFIVSWGALKACKLIADAGRRTRRVWCLFFFHVLSTLIGLAIWLMITVGSDLMFILDQERVGGVKLQVSDSAGGGWSSSSVFAENTSVVRIADPGSWVALPTQSVLWEDTVTKCMKYGKTTGNGKNKKRKCENKVQYNTLEQMEIAMWQYQGAPVTSGSPTSPSACANPMKDQFPNRTVFLDLTRPAKLNATQDVKFRFNTPTIPPYFDYGPQPAPPPNGVESVKMVFLNLDAETTPSGARWDMTALESVATADLLGAKWTTIVFYDLRLNSTANLLSKLAGANIRFIYLSPSHLNATLAAAPYSLSATERATVFDTTVNSTVNSTMAKRSDASGALRYWISRVTLEDSEEAAVKFSGPQEVKAVSQWEKFDGSIYFTKNAQASWTYYSESEEGVDGGEGDQWWSIWILPSPGKCSYPTLMLNTGEGSSRQSEAVPTLQSAGGYIYTGEYSHWFQGRRNFGKQPEFVLDTAGVDAYFEWYPHVPLMGGRYPMPGWCTGFADAETFFAVTLVLFVLIGVIGVILCLEFCYTRVVQGDRKKNSRIFKRNANKWWHSRTKHVKTQNPGYVGLGEMYLVDGDIYEIEPESAPGMRIDVMYSGTDDGTKLHLYTKNGTNAQRFTARQVLDEEDHVYYIFEPRCAPGKAIDNYGTSRKQCHLWNHLGYSNKNTHFYLEPADGADGYYSVIARTHGGHRWDLAGAKRGNGTPLITWSDDPGYKAHRHFKFKKVGTE